MKIWVNGHEWAKQQATKAGIGFTELSNGFAAFEDPAQCHVVQHDHLRGGGDTCLLACACASSDGQHAFCGETACRRGALGEPKGPYLTAWAPQVASAPTSDPAHQPHLGSPSCHR
jgi:hypothetical protein